MELGTATACQSAPRKIVRFGLHRSSKLQEHPALPSGFRFCIWSDLVRSWVALALQLPGRWCAKSRPLTTACFNALTARHRQARAICGMETPKKETKGMQQVSVGLFIVVRGLRGNVIGFVCFADQRASVRFIRDRFVRTVSCIVAFSCVASGLQTHPVDFFHGRKVASQCRSRKPMEARETANLRRAGILRLQTYRQLLTSMFSPGCLRL